MKKWILACSVLAVAVLCADSALATGFGRRAVRQRVVVRPQRVVQRAVVAPVVVQPQFVAPACSAFAFPQAVFGHQAVFSSGFAPALVSPFAVRQRAVVVGSASCF